MDEEPKPPYHLKAIIVGSVFVVAGLIALIISIQTDEKAHELLKPLLREFATIAIIGGSLHVVYELFQRQEYVRAIDKNTASVLRAVGHTSSEVLGKLALGQQATQIGLSEARSDASTYDYGPFIEKAEDITVILNDGRTWVSSNAARLRKRFEDPSKRTRFFFVHPKSPMVKVIARKEGTSEEALAAKINETLAMLASISSPKAQLRVYGHYLFNPHSAFVSESYSIISPYFHSRTRRNVPALRFDDGSEGAFFREIKADMESLLFDSEELTLSTAESPAASIK